MASSAWSFVGSRKPKHWVQVGDGDAALSPVPNMLLQVMFNLRLSKFCR